MEEKVGPSARFIHLGCTSSDIVDTANGVLLTERGVHTDPPLGAAVAWPVAASVAVAKQDKLWVVELAIPLSAFGPAGKESFWGVNFTRFATQGSESSSWAGSPRYFYDPKNLGTMFLGAPEKDATAEATTLPASAK